MFNSFINKVMSYVDRWHSKWYDPFTMLFLVVSITCFHLFGLKGWAPIAILPTLALGITLYFFIQREYRRFSVKDSKNMFDPEDSSLRYKVESSLLSSMFWENLYDSHTGSVPYSALQEELIKVDRKRANRIRMLYPKIHHFSDKALVHSLRLFEKYRGELLSTVKYDFDYMAYLYLSEDYGQPLKVENQFQNRF
jgi:hypothetical protein